MRKGAPCARRSCARRLYCFLFNDTATTEIYPLSLHDALPIWVTDENVDFRRSEVTLVEFDVFLPIELDKAECFLAKLFHRVRFTRRDNVVVGLVLLQHYPHRLDVLGCVAPVAFRIEIAEEIGR